MNTKKVVLILCLAAGLFSIEARALPLLTIDLQPIFVCDDDGNNCANSGMELFEDIGDAIWAQADIDLNFLTAIQVNDSDKLNETSFGDLGLNADSSVLNIWFIESLSDCGGYYNPLSLFGCGGGRVAVTDLVFDFNGGIGRLDTISHEVGHVLGLGHSDFGAGGGENVMTSGGSRSIPDSLDDIANTHSFLTDEQIAEARSHDEWLYTAASVPEPSVLALLGLGLIGIAVRRRVAA